MTTEPKEAGAAGVNATRWRKEYWGLIAWLILALAVALFAATRFASGVPLQTNLLALLPPTERNPVAEQAIEKLAMANGDRVVLLFGHADFASAARAARGFASQLRSEPAFAQVTADIPAFDPRSLVTVYGTHRFNFITASDRALLGNAQFPAEQRLQQKLHAPFNFGPRLPLLQDPFAIVDQWLAELPLRSLRLELEDGLLTRQSDGRHWVLVNAQLATSAYDQTLQEKALNAIDAAAAAHAAPGARGAAGVEMLRTGTLFYAAEARRAGEREAHMITAVSLAGILILLFGVFRSFRPLFLGLITVGFGILCAVVGVTWVHGEMHLLTLVFGATLIGEAIDYPIQYFAAHLGAGPAWQPMASLKRIAPGLAMALGTSLLGYAILLFAPFPALHQIALFAVIGLTAAWITVFLLLPACLRRPGRRDPDQAVAAMRRWLDAWHRNASKRRVVLVVLLLLALAIPGWLQLSGNDDIRQLINRPPALLEQENKIRALTGFDNSSQFFLIEGANSEAVLRAEEALRPRLAEAVRAGQLTGYQALSSFVPSARQQLANHATQSKLYGDTAGLRATFEQVGIDAEQAEAQAAAWNSAAGQTLSLESWLTSPLAQPVRHLWLGATSTGYASVIAPQGLRDPQAARALARLAEGLPGVSYVDKAHSISEVFRSYRHWGFAWLAGALCIILAALALRYRRGAIRVFLPTLLALGLTLALFGWLDRPLTLFTLMGLLLVSGIGVNYAIFLREGGVSQAATLAGVGLSAATTLLSFGLLAFSSMPVLADFGLTLLIGIGIAVLLAPLGSKPLAPAGTSP